MADCCFCYLEPYNALIKKAKSPNSPEVFWKVIGQEIHWIKAAT